MVLKSERTKRRMHDNTHHRIPTHTSIYQRMAPNATIFRVSICYHQLKYYTIKLTAKFYIDTISQTTKTPSFYVNNRIAIGRPTIPCIQLALVVGTNQPNECWAAP